MKLSTLKLTRREGLAIVRLDRKHGNAIDSDMVDELRRTFNELSDDDGAAGVLLAATGKMFCPGLDLRELVHYDRVQLQDFMERFGTMMLALYTFPKPLVAAISGHALAGGCLLTLTADRRVLTDGAMVGLNEVQVGVPLPFGQALMLREAVEPSRLEEAALSGRNYSGEEAVAAGLVHEVRPARGFEPHCLAVTQDLASRDARAFATTKRYLRSATVERIQRHDANLRGEFLDCWFSEGTRRRMREVVERLGAPKQA